MGGGSKSIHALPAPDDGDAGVVLRSEGGDAEAFFGGARAAEALCTSMRLYAVCSCCSQPCCPRIRCEHLCACLLPIAPQGQGQGAGGSQPSTAGLKWNTNKYSIFGGAASATGAGNEGAKGTAAAASLAVAAAVAGATAAGS